MEGKEPKELCDSCGAADAVVHLTQIEHNEMKISHLCEKCAAAKGVEEPDEAVNFPLTGFLAQLGDDAAAPEAAESVGSCSFCGLTFNDFLDPCQNPAYVESREVVGGACLKEDRESASVSDSRRNAPTERE